MEQLDKRDADIRNLLSFRLTRLSQVSDSLGQRWLKQEFGLRLLEWRIIGLTAVTAPIRFAELARTLRTDKGQLSRMTSTLVEKGLLELRLDPGDQRSRLVHLTEAGHALYDRILPGITERDDAMSGQLSAAELETLNRLLDKLQTVVDTRHEQGI